MKSLKNYKLFFLVFLLAALCAALCAAISLSSTVTVSATSTPRYKLIFNYESSIYNSYNGLTKVEGSGSGDTASVKVNDGYNIKNADFSIYLSGNTYTSSIQSQSNNFFNFSDIRLSATRGGSYTIKNGNGSTLKSGTLTSSDNTLTLSDGEYTLTGAIVATNQISGGGYNITTRYTTNYDATFIIDTQPPTVTISCGDNGFSKNNVSVEFSDSRGVSSATYTRGTGASFPSSASTAFNSGKSFTDEGNYTIKVTDKAGNVTTKYFTIDKTAPSLSLSDVTVGGFTNGNVSASWSTAASGAGYNRVNANDVLTVKYSRSTTSSFPSSASTAYSSGTTLSSEGNYLITITDKAGNSKDYKFTIDKTAPSLSLSGVTVGGFTNGNVSASWSTTVGNVGAQLVNSNDELTVKYNSTSNASFPSSANIVYTNGTALTAEGNYRIEISDAAGNSSFLVFTIDKTAPTFSLSTSDNSSFINNRTAKDVSASWYKTVGGKGTQRMNANDVLTVKYSRSTTSSFPSSADEIYTEGEMITTEGKYRFEMTDSAGNVTVKQFEIYRQAPTFTVYSASGEELSKTPLAYNKDIKIAFSNCTARLNDKSYTSGTLLSAEGEYSFILTDELGNTTSETVYIIKTPPTLNFDRLQTPINRWYETTDADGNVYSFASYDNAYIVADERERSTIVGGVWTSTTWDGGVPIADEDLPIAAQGMAYYKYKSFGSASTTHAYFSIATLNKAVEKYVIASINIKYTPSIPAQSAEGEVVYRDIYFSKDAITFNRINNCTLYIDGTARNYPYTLTEIGQHNIIERDIAGNMVTYSVIIDAAPPIVRVTNLNGNMPQALVFGRDHYFTYGLRIYLDDVDEQALLRIKDENTGIEDYYIGGVIELRAAGIYTITARDAAGNSGNLSIYISLIEPTIDIKENEVVTDVVNSFTVTINKNFNLNAITNLSVYKLDTESGSWNALSTDNSSFPVSINKNTFTYTFDVSGTYRIIVVDVFGRYLEKEYSFIKGSPKGTLSTTGGTVLTSGDSTRNNFYFTWSNLLNCSAEISVNGAVPIAYTKGTIITAEGSYSIKLYSNVDDVYNIYTITIDKTAPSGVLSANGTDLPNGSTTRHSVTLSWEEVGCTALLNGEPYANGSAVAEEGDYTIELSDKAGNKRTFTFRIKTTPPKVTLSTSMGKIASYDVTKYDVYVSWNERNCVCVVNGVTYTQNTRINVENSYTVILTDAYGNTNSCFFTIDKTAPSGQLFVDGQEVATSTTIFTNKKVNFIWAELGCSATINDDFIYTSGSIIAEDGTYTIKLTDAAGNVASYNFVIKTSSPKAKLLTNGAEVASGARTKYEARLIWTEAGCTATVNGEPYSKGALINDTGIYAFALSDAVGNVVYLTIEVYKIVPNAEIVPINNFALPYLNDGFTITWSEEDCTATLNGQNYEKETEITEEGEYTFILVNKVGLEFVENIIIDRTAPSISIYDADGNEVTNDICLSYVYFDWTEAGCTATVNGDTYKAKTYMTKDGVYTLLLTDAAGNVGSRSIRIARTKPTVALIKSDGNELSNGGSTVDSVVIVVTSGTDATVTVDEIDYVIGEEITNIGTHTVVVTDVYGNVAQYSFTIKEPSAQRDSANPFANLVKGSPTGSYILIALIAVIVVVGIVVPLVKAKRKGAFRNKLK